MLLMNVISAIPLSGFQVLVEFNDHTHREIDLEVYLHGPMFEPMRADPALFRALSVSDGAITWPNGADIDSQVLYYGLKPAWLEEHHPVESQTA